MTVESSPREEYVEYVEKMLDKSYKHPELLAVFNLLHDKEFIDTICVVSTEDRGIVIGGIFVYQGEDLRRFGEMHRDVKVGKMYYSDSIVSDCIVGFCLIKGDEKPPEDAYCVKSFYLDDEKYYICYTFIDYYDEGSIWPS